MEPFRDAGELPRAFGPPVGDADFKQSVEDFIVREHLGFELSGAGEHVWLRIEKRGLNTMDVVKRISRRFRIPQRDISYAGLKDRQAVTEQWISVRTGLNKEYPFAELTDDCLSVLEQRRNHRKLRRGSHRGNRFTIRLRNVSAVPVDLETRLAQIQNQGIPNYFGPQRFGHDGDNLIRAQSMFRDEIRVRDRFQRGIYLSAARSFLFNEVLSKRVEIQAWDRFMVGDVVSLDGSERGGFQPDAFDDVLQARLKDFDIHPSGPLWGKGAPSTTGEAAELESDTVARWPVFRDGLIAHGLEQGRRALRARVEDMTMRSEGEGQVVVEFSLHQGVYATAVLRELVNLRLDRKG